MRGGGGLRPFRAGTPASATATASAAPLSLSPRRSASRHSVRSGGGAGTPRGAYASSPPRQRGGAAAAGGGVPALSLMLTPRSVPSVLSFSARSVATGVSLRSGSGTRIASPRSFDSLTVSQRGTVTARRDEAERVLAADTDALAGVYTRSALRVTPVEPEYTPHRNRLERSFSTNQTYGQTTIWSADMLPREVPRRFHSTSADVPSLLDPDADTVQAAMSAAHSGGGRSDVESAVRGVDDGDGPHRTPKARPRSSFSGGEQLRELAGELTVQAGHLRRPLLPGVALWPYAVAARRGEPAVGTSSASSYAASSGGSSVGSARATLTEAEVLSASPAVSSYTRAYGVRRRVLDSSPASLRSGPLAASDSAAWGSPRSDVAAAAAASDGTGGDAVPGGAGRGIAGVGSVGGSGTALPTPPPDSCVPTAVSADGSFSASPLSRLRSFHATARSGASKLQLRSASPTLVGGAAGGEPAPPEWAFMSGVDTKRGAHATVNLSPHTVRMRELLARRRSLDGSAERGVPVGSPSSARRAARHVPDAEHAVYTLESEAALWRTTTYRSATSAVASPRAQPGAHVALYGARAPQSAGAGDGRATPTSSAARYAPFATAYNRREPPLDTSTLS